MLVPFARKPLPIAALSEICIAGSALLIALAAQWTLTSLIPGMNYHGLDGKLAQSAAIAAYRFSGYFDVTNVSPLQGIGSLMLPKNVWANPAFWPFALFGTETAAELSALIAFACFAGAVYIMMRCFDCAVGPSAVAALSCIVLFAPAVVFLRMPMNFLITPGDAVVYAPYMLALGLLARLDGASWRTLAAAAGLSALIFYAVYCDPLWAMVAAISWAVPFAVVTLSAWRLETIASRIAALGCCFALLGASGAAGYLYTLSQYTARVQFAQVLDRARGPDFVSAVSYSPYMKYFYLACVLGWLFGLVMLRGRPRVLVAAAVAAFIVWLAYALVYVLILNATWVLPIPRYVEHGLFAFYLAAAIAGFWSMRAAAASLLARLAASLARPFGGEEKRWLARLQAAVLALAFLGAATIAGKAVTDLLPRAQTLAKGIHEPWPNEPELVDFFAQELGLTTGQSFRGAVNFLAADPATLNTIAAVWARGVPTLNEYSQLVTPEALYFVHALLKRDVRGELNHFNMFWSAGSYTPAYWTALQMLGVRYTAAPWRLPDEFNPGLPLITKPHRPHPANRESGTWYIHELPHPNLGDYSPTEVVTAGSGRDIMTILGTPGFDFTRQAILLEPVNERLVPARHMRVSIIRGGLHVSGTSDRASLVLLPQQFSHCLRARDPNVRLVRANLMVTAMIFSGDVDTDIVHDYGIFSPACRRADLSELKGLDLHIDPAMPHLTGPVWPDWSGAVARLRVFASAIR